MSSNLANKFETNDGFNNHSNNDTHKNKSMFLRPTNKVEIRHS